MAGYATDPAKRRTTGKGPPPTLHPEDLEGFEVRHRRLRPLPSATVAQPGSTSGLEPAAVGLANGVAQRRMAPVGGENLCRLVPAESRPAVLVDEAPKEGELAVETSDHGPER